MLTQLILALLISMVMSTGVIARTSHVAQQTATPPTVTTMDDGEPSPPPPDGGGSLPGH